MTNFEILLIAMAAFTLGHFLGWMRRAELEHKKHPNLGENKGGVNR